MRRWLVANAVLGKSRTRRGGPARVLTLGTTGWLEVSSTCSPSGVPATCTCLRFTRAVEVTSAAFAASGFPASANWLVSSSVKNMTSNCFRISLLPTPGSGRVFLRAKNLLPSVFVLNFVSGLNCRSRNLLHYFARAQVTELVLNGFLEHNGVAADLQHVPVEDRIVLPQEVRFVEAVDDNGNHAGFGFDDATQRDLVNLQAALSRAAAGAGQVLDDRADKRIAAVTGGDEAFFLRLWGFFFCVRLRVGFCVGRLGARGLCVGFCIGGLGARSLSAGLRNRGFGERILFRCGDRSCTFGSYWNCDSWLGGCRSRSLGSR